MILTFGYFEMIRRINNTTVNITKKLTIVNFITEQHHNMLTVKGIIITLI